MSIDAPDKIEIVDASAIEMITRGEIDVQVSTAHKYPRSITRFKETALAMATLDEETAGSCMYAVPRAGKTIEGPSARFAEIVAQAWGNMRVASRMIGEDAGFVTLQSVCHDLESNVAIGIEVKRRITDKNGQRYKDDMIGVTANAGLSIAIRNSVLKVVPKAFWKPVYDEARKVAIGDVKTLANKRADMLAAFQKMGVKPEQVCAAVSRPSVEDIGLDELATLRGLFTSLREGEVRLEEAFPKPPVGVEQQPGESRAQAVARTARQAAVKPAAGPRQGTESTGVVSETTKPVKPQPAASGSVLDNPGPVKDPLETTMRSSETRSEPGHEEAGVPVHADPPVASSAGPAGSPSLSAEELERKDFIDGIVELVEPLQPPERMRALSKAGQRANWSVVKAALPKLSLEELRTLFGLLKV